MAHVQLQDKYTQIDNELLDALGRIDLSGRQMNIVIVVIRYTFGFHRSEHQLGATYIAKKIGLQKSQIAADLVKLINRKILTVVVDHTKTKARILAVNTNFKEWVSRKPLTVNESTDSAVLKTLDTSVNGFDDHIKDKIKEIINIPFDAVSFRTGEKSITAEVPAIATDQPWHKNSVFTVTQAYQKELSKQYGMPEGKLKKQFEQMDKWLKEKKTTKLNDSNGFISDWLEKHKEDLPDQPKVTLQPISSDTPPWQDN